MLIGFNHTGLVVRDLETMVQFYTQQIGLKVLFEVDSVAPPDGDHTGGPGARRKLIFVGLDGDHKIEFVYYIDPPATEGHLDKHQFGSMHVCFDVADLRQTYESLSGRGVKFVTEPKFREVEGKNIGVIYAYDPEGNLIEFIEGLRDK